jgi:hypothetical protein
MMAKRKDEVQLLTPIMYSDNVGGKRKIKG